MRPEDVQIPEDALSETFRTAIERAGILTLAGRKKGALGLPEPSRSEGQNVSSLAGLSGPARYHCDRRGKR